MQHIYFIAFFGGMAGLSGTLLWAVINGGWPFVLALVASGLALYIGRNTFVEGEDYYTVHKHLQ